MSLNRVAALKVLAAEFSEDPAFRERFRREGQLQAAIDHPHIVTVYEAGDSFVDRGDENVHIARASPFDGVELWATYFVPGSDPSAPFRLDASDPGTGC